MLYPNVVAGVHRVEDAFTNWYVIETDGRLTVVDAGVPSSWDSLHALLRAIDRSPDDIEAVVLTHAHFDHVGFAEQAPGASWGCPCTSTRTTRRSPGTRGATTTSGRARPTSRRRSRRMPIVAALARHRAFFPSAVKEVIRFDGGTLARARLTERRLLARATRSGTARCTCPTATCCSPGDALVTLDPYTARKGPRLVARAATADAERNLRSLDALAETGATHVLTGHGEPWHQGIEAACSTPARRAPRRAAPPIPAAPHRRGSPPDADRLSSEGNHLEDAQPLDPRHGPRR